MVGALGSLYSGIGNDDLSSPNLEKLVLLMRSSQYWTNYCTQRLIDMLSRNCPNLICLGGFLKEDVVQSVRSKDMPDIDFGRYVEAKYTSITHKLTQLRLAEESRIGLMSELALLLKEAGADQDEEVMSASLLQNFAEGGTLVDDFVHSSSSSKSRSKKLSVSDSNLDSKIGSDVLHSQYGHYLDLVNMFECQLQYEDIFWKWLLPPQADSSVSDPLQAKSVSSLRALEGVLFASLMTSKPSENASLIDSLRGALEHVNSDVSDRLIAQDSDDLKPVKDLGGAVREDIVDRLMRHCVLSTTPYCSELDGTTSLQEDLQKKREIWCNTITALMKIPNPHCPYDMLLK